MAGWALAASGRFATADELTNLLMSLAPVLLTYGGHLYARDRRRAWTAVALLTVAAAHPWSTSMQAAADGLLYICAPMLFGFYRETQRMLVRTLTDRARDAERERDLCADQARAQERTRMAVELHDVVTHRVSLMVLHAGALRITTADAAVRDAAEHVRAIGCEALAELRELIGVLRGSRRPLPRRWPDRRMIRSWRHRAFGGAADRPVRSVLRGGRGSVDAAAQHPRGHRAAGRQRRAALPWLEIGLQLPLAAALVLRRRHPHAAAVPTLAGTVVLLGLAVTGSAGLHATGDSTRLLVPAVAPLVAYTVAAHSRRPVLGTAVVLALLALAARPWDPYAVVVSVAAVFIGLRRCWDCTSECGAASSRRSPNAPNGRGANSGCSQNGRGPGNGPGSPGRCTPSCPAGSTTCWTGRTGWAVRPPRRSPRRPPRSWPRPDGRLSTNCTTWRRVPDR